MSSRKESGKSRGPRGKGSIRINKAGSYEYRFSYVDEFYQLRQKSITCKTIDECVERAEEFRLEIERRGKRIQPEATLTDIISQKAKQDYLKNYTSEQGYGRNLETIKIIERSNIGKMRIGDIQPWHIDQFLSSITCYADKSISKIYGMVKTAFEIAYAEKAIDVNYMNKHDARRPKSVKPKKKVRGFTEEEQVAFLKALEEHKVPYGRNTYKLQLLIELYSGMRMGEINALRPDCIDFKNKRIYVRATVAKGIDARQFIQESTKTEAGQRHVPISAALEPVLRQALDEMKSNPEGLIFFDYGKKNRKGSPYKNGGLVETSQVNCFFKRICKKAGIDANFGQHSLRHTFATRCIEAGIQPVVLQRWLGHTDIHMTLDTYTDVFAKLHAESTDKFDDLISQINNNI